MKKGHVVFVIIASVFVLTGCSRTGMIFSQDADALFMEIYENCSMNEALHLSVMEPIPGSENRLVVLLESVSDKSVMLPPGFNLQLFSFNKDDGKWIQENNYTQYFPADGYYMIGRNDPETELANLFIPIKPSVKNKMKLRAVVYGHIYENGIETDECTGAFVDFEFTP